MDVLGTEFLVTIVLWQLYANEKSVLGDSGLEE
jgi:hypothetical protein